MRIFLAGATGVIGSRLTPVLVQRGDTVAGMTRSPEQTEMLKDFGAEPLVCDIYDADSLSKAISAFRPDLDAPSGVVVVAEPR
jgi:nucleoside-diphosphate-sugar epimerase